MTDRISSSFVFLLLCNICCLHLLLYQCMHRSKLYHRRLLRWPNITELNMIVCDCLALVTDSAVIMYEHISLFSESDVIMCEHISRSVNESAVVMCEQI